MTNRGGEFRIEIDLVEGAMWSSELLTISTNFTVFDPVFLYWLNFCSTIHFLLQDISH